MSRNPDVINSKAEIIDYLAITEGLFRRFTTEFRPPLPAIEIRGAGWFASRQNLDAWWRHITARRVDLPGEE